MIDLTQFSTLVGKALSVDLSDEGIAVDADLFDETQIAVKYLFVIIVAQLNNLITPLEKCVPPWRMALGLARPVCSRK